jgi:5-oxoprolinase (ATP-hydrolysing) subunit C
MSAALCALAPGPYVTIQDPGRHGWRRFGVSVSGAMDLPALAMANALVGNTPESATLEFAHVGGSWKVLAESARVAVTGGSFGIAIDGVAVEPWRSHTLRRGQVLSIKGASDAVWGYLAVGQGFDVAPQLGSCATHLRSGLGGINGSRIAEGDTLPLRAACAPPGRERRIVPTHRETGPLRVILGPQDDYFTPDTIAGFLGATWSVTHRSDRMGTWLDGPPIAHADSFNVVSDGLGPGCLQVPGGGQPVVLMMDCQTIGGYPKLATIIAADLPRFAQTRPGTPINFARISIEYAQHLYRAHSTVLGEIGHSVAEVPARSSLPFWLRG